MEHLNVTHNDDYVLIDIDPRAAQSLAAAARHYHHRLGRGRLRQTMLDVSNRIREVLERMEDR